jgi:hypothetical protein
MGTGYSSSCFKASVISLETLLRRTDEVQKRTKHDIWYSVTLTFSDSSFASLFSCRLPKQILCTLIIMHNVRWFHFNFGNDLRDSKRNSKTSNFSFSICSKQFNFETKKLYNSMINGIEFKFQSNLLISIK